MGCLLVFPEAGGGGRERRQRDLVWRWFARRGFNDSPRIIHRRGAEEAAHSFPSLLLRVSASLR